MLPQIAHSNPVVVFDTILSQIQSYDNLIQPMVDAFKYLTPLAFDVLSFVLISHLASDAQKLKSDGTNTSQWLSALAQFCGVLYRKYPSTELSGLFQYLLAKLKAGESLDLLVLKELITR